MVATTERKRIARELPPVGTILIARYKKRSYAKRRCFTARIVGERAFRAGRAVKYRNRIFASVSAAAKAITGYPINGWTFWHRRPRQRNRHGPGRQRLQISAGR